jgi:hypothetical protein
LLFVLSLSGNDISFSINNGSAKKLEYAIHQHIIKNCTCVENLSGHDIISFLVNTISEKSMIKPIEMIAIILKITEKS